MSGFSINLGDVFGGLGKGLKAGIQYDVDFARLYLKAEETGDKALRDDLNGVWKQFLKEAADEAGVVRGNIAGLLLGGSDPFAGSRHLLQDVRKKHNV